jgi:hypothetical protein
VFSMRLCFYEIDNDPWTDGRNGSVLINSELKRCSGLSKDSTDRNCRKVDATSWPVPSIPSGQPSRVVAGR